MLDLFEMIIFSEISKLSDGHNWWKALKNCKQKGEISKLFKQKFFALAVKFWMQFWNTFDTGTLFWNKTLKALLFACFWQGTKWYRTTKGKKLGAWGFAHGASPINLQYYDWLDSDGEKRLSWDVNQSGGGRRCGTDKSLLNSQNWERVIYHAAHTTTTTTTNNLGRNQ